MSNILSTLLVLASVSTTEVDATKGFLAISDHPQKQNHSFILERCDDFLQALDIYSDIIVSNPVHGTDETRSAPFEWLHSLQEAIWNIKKSNLVDVYPSFLGDYMNAFGLIRLPSPVPNLPLYISDKATCLTTFGEEL